MLAVRPTRAYSARHRRLRTFLQRSAVGLYLVLFRVVRLMMDPLARDSPLKRAVPLIFPHDMNCVLMVLNEPS